MNDDGILNELKKSIKPIKKKDKVKASDIPKTVFFDTHNSKDYSADFGDLTRSYGNNSANYIEHGQLVGVSKSTAKLLKSGKIEINAKIDLHGMTKEQAFEVLFEFVMKNYDKQMRNLLVITGKGKEGQGVLFENVPKWLNLDVLREKIIMFDYAHDKDGGKGALYIILKRKK